MSIIQERLLKLRRQMAQQGLDAFIISGTDPHQSEYVCPRWRTRAWISGFTGSAGTVVITADTAGLWTDSRYFLQAEKELEGTGVDLFKVGMPGVPDHTAWLVRQLPAGSCIGTPAAEISMASAAALQELCSSKGLVFTATDDLLEHIWDDRPALPDGKIRAVDTALTGRTREDKIAAVRDALASAGAQSTVISSLDDIAWLLNLRGADVAYNPVFLSFLCITPDSVTLFCDAQKFADEGELKHLAKRVHIEPYAAVYSRIASLIPEGTSVYLSPERISSGLRSAVPATCPIVEGVDISTRLKAVKNPVELEGMKQVHRTDGAALTAFLHWIDRTWDQQLEPLDECTLAQKLLSFRQEAEGFLGESFSPIAGYRDHGAACHYSATPQSAYPITGEGLLVLDTGGQYLGGTTDVTRTLVFGKPSVDQIRDYTLVLKGHLAVRRQKFPEGTCGYQIDSVARTALWNEGLSYSHGTGHGVGHMLNVHEGPQNISTKPITVALEAGMVVSNEPGLYREGRHGIRIENLVVVTRREQTEFGQFLGFDDLTMCPYERKLIDSSLLTDQERQQVDDYHARVYEALSGRLSQEVSDWLKQRTRPID